VSALAEKMGFDLGLGDIKAVQEEMVKAVPAYGTLTAGGFWGEGLFSGAFMTPDGKGRFSAFEIDVTPESGEKRHLLSDENYFRANVRARLTA
jgi:hypothetical protein